MQKSDREISPRYHRVDVQINMRVLVILVLTSLAACAPFDSNEDSFIVVAEKPITLNWGIHQQNADQPTLYQHRGIPGNLATFPKTRGPQDELLRAIVLGDPLPVGHRIRIRVLGIHEQVSSNGLLCTIIATTDLGQDLEALEKEHSGALAVIEAGLVQLNGANARSLGFRSARIAARTATAPWTIEGNSSTACLAFAYRAATAISFSPAHMRRAESGHSNSLVKCSRSST